MAKSKVNTTVVIALAAVAVVYIMSKKNTSTTQSPIMPSPNVAQNQLNNWAQSQNNSGDWVKLISSLNVNSIIDLWNKVFGGSDDSNMDFSGSSYDELQYYYNDYYGSGSYLV